MTTKTVPQLIEVEVPEGYYVGSVRMLDSKGLASPVCVVEGRGFRLVPPGRAVPDELIKALQYQEQLDADGVMVGVSRQALDELLALLTAQPVDGDPPIDWKRRAEIAEAKLLRLKASGIRPPVGFGDFVPVEALLAAAPAEVKKCDMPQRQSDYEAGFKRAAERADRSDILYDVGSPLYIKDMTADLLTESANGNLIEEVIWLLKEYAPCSPQVEEALKKLSALIVAEPKIDENAIRPIVDEKFIDRVWKRASNKFGIGKALTFSDCAQLVLEQYKEESK